MEKVYNNVSEIIGKTPILRLQNVEKNNNVNARIYGKLECFNPTGSIKDRAASEMINDALLTGRLKEGGVIIEPTSGNTGIGIASIATSMGYKAILTMPDSMSEERRSLLRLYGAEIVLTEGARGMKGAIEKAEEIHANTPNSVVMGQFVNEANPQAHYKTTGPEIWEDMNGEVDVFISAIGTGGTITGVGRYLKENNPHIKIIGVEPIESAVISGENPGKHGIQGIGAGFVPKILDTSIIDEMIKVNTQDAYRVAKEMSMSEGVFVGISSGASLCAAIEIASRKEYQAKNIVAILPDSGDRYISVFM